MIKKRKNNSFLFFDIKCNMKRIKELIECDYSYIISGITDDSREVKKDYIFVATKGYNVDHYDYIDEAINKGAVFIVTDRFLRKDYPHIIVDNIDNYYKELCIKFYDIDLDNFHFIGITGTDGKTTTATIVKYLIKDIAYIGTNGLTIKNKTISTNNTTPCINEFYKYLKLIQDKGINNVVMEVSSEALLHKRVDNIRFDIIAFTNITGDHLNIHKSFDNYVKSKLKLLDLLKEDGCVVVNDDDNYLHNINCQKKITLGYNKCNKYYIYKNETYKEFVKIYVKSNNNTLEIDSPYQGKHNIYNVVEAFIISKLFGIDENTLLKRIKKLPPIKGRGEVLDFGQEYKIVLDYAHTINGIKNILETYKDYKQIITVTGCAGGREKEKRREIGKLVLKYSDVSIFTMDDPRWEDVNDIINQMVGEDTNYIRIINREEAIHYALSIARKDNVVLILGKGRDNYMAIEDKKIKYNDYDVIKKYFI